MSARVVAILLLCAPADGDSGTCDQIGRYRIAAIDTPELHGQCPAEIAMAQRARVYAAEFLAVPVLVQHDGKRDRYARLLVRITRDGRDLGRELVERGMARTWTGRREPWCP